MNSRQVLWVVLLGTLGLGLLYSSTVPNGFGPDEVSHFGYVRALATGRGLPVLGRDADPRGALYEAHQPPLYYLLAVPFYRVGRATAGEDGSWRAVRGFTLLCGLASVALVWSLLAGLFPDEPYLAAAGAAFTGWLPSQALLFGVVSNDPLTEAAFTATLVLLLRAFKTGRGRHAAACGLAAGLGFWVKSSALLLIPAAAAAFALNTAWQRERRVRSVALFLAGASAALPWMARNVAVYGDPLAWSAFTHYFVAVMHSPTPVGLAARTGAVYSPAWYWFDRVLPWAFRDSLGMWLFSRSGGRLPMRVGIPSGLYWAWGGLWVAAIAGLVRFSTRDVRQLPRENRTLIGASAVLLALLFVAYLRLNALFFWAQSRYLFPAVAVLAMGWAIGLSRVVPARVRPAGLAAVSAGLLIVSIYAAFVVLGGYFDAALGRG